MHDFTPIAVSRQSSLEERQLALTQIYHQVLERQPYISERQAITALEKDFLKDKIGVRRFLKHFACTDIYLDQFYYKLSNVKFMDVCFKHFLGRAILDLQEMHLYSNVLAKQGVSNLITALLDSEEYRKAFGCFTVPYPRASNYYRSPEAFLASKLLNAEHIGQRGLSVPTLYWRQLGLDCTSGVCRRPEVDARMTAATTAATTTTTTTAEVVRGEASDIETLLRILKTSDVTKAKALLTQLSPQQREALLTLG